MQNAHERLRRRIIEENSRFSRYFKSLSVHIFTVPKNSMRMRTIQMLGDKEQILTQITRIQAGQYSVDDGRFIIKQGADWFVIDATGSHDFGPVPTLQSAKQYVNSRSTPLGMHNFGSQYGRRQSKKEFSAYLASEAKNGNPMPAILWFVVLSVVCALLFIVRGY